MSAHKVMLLGEIGVGKTSLVRRLVDDQFDADYGPTTGVDIYQYMVKLDGADGQRDAELTIWDTDGDFGENIFRHAYIKGASGALIIGDATRRYTQESMASLAEMFSKTIQGRPFSFVLNKLDLLAGEPAPDLAESLKGSEHLFHTSAKTGENVRLAFHDIAATILRRRF